MEDPGLQVGRKAVLVVLFVPSVGLVIGDEYLAFRDFAKE